MPPYHKILLWSGDTDFNVQLQQEVDKISSLEEIATISSESLVLVLHDLSADKIHSILEELKNSRRFIGVLVFGNSFSPQELSKWMKSGVYCFYESDEVEQLDSILKHEGEAILEYNAERKRNTYLHLISDNIEEVFFEFDSAPELESKWRLNFVTENLVNICGESAATCLQNQRKWWELIHPDDTKILHDLTKKAIKTLAVVVREYRIKNAKTNRYNWVRDRITPVADSNGRVTHFYGAARIIQTEKEYEKQLTSTKDFLNNVISTSPNILYVLDYRSKLMVFGLQKFAEYLAYTPEEIGAMSDGVYSLVHPDDITAVKDQERQLAEDKTDRVVPVDMRLKHKELGYRWFTVYSKIFKRDENGKPTMEVGSVTDIDQIKTAEKTFRNIFDNSEDLIYIQNQKGEFIDVNLAVEEKYGIDKGEILGKTPEFLGAPGKNDLDYVEQLLAKAWEGETVRFDWWSRTKTGEVFPKEVIVQTGEYFDQKVLIAVGRDMTEWKKADEEKSKLIEQLVEQNQDLEQFSYIISHNLRSPVAAILGLVQILELDELGAENQEIVQHIENSTKSLDSVIQDLNQTLNIRKSKTEMKDYINLAQKVEKCKLSLSASIKSCDAIIINEFSDDFEIHSIRSYLYNILYNLLSNAIKYRHPERQPIIEIKAYKQKAHTIISVSDNGLGFDAKKLSNRLFGLYERFHSHVEGKGLGLYLVKQQVETLGGSITVQSKVGEGSVFTLKLPTS